MNGDPVRLQLRRTKGFDLRRLSVETNGRAAMVVARPGRYGNLYRVGVDGDAAACVKKFRAYLFELKVTQPVLYEAYMQSLRGFNLACWCAIDEPWCHANVQLELANQKPIITPR